MSVVASISRAAGRRGFTLVEMLTVMLLMAIILMAGVVSWNSVKRGSEMRTAINDVRSSMALARQYAVLKRTVIRIDIPDPAGQGYYITNMAGGSLMRGGFQELPLGVRFGNTAAYQIDFRPNGGIKGNQSYDLILVDVLNSKNTNVLSVNGLTGIINYE
jgi:prepilin-type N-terminal cleavage/methylation domain-containing protein